MKRLVSLFVLSMFILFITCSSSAGNEEFSDNEKTQINPEIIIKDNLEIPLEESTRQAGEWEYYTDYTELSTLLQEQASKYPKILRLFDDRGTTFEGRKLWMVKISDNPSSNEDHEPEVLFVGAHHGNELVGNEMAILIITTLTDGYGKDPRITWLVDNNEIWIIPMPNPDGTEYTFNTESWRKNRSPNYISESTPGPISPKIYPTSYGVDLNRNYDMAWGDPEGSSVLLQRSSTYAGPEPFSEFETQAIRDLVLAHNFSVYLDYHSGIELILYPWGYTSEPTPDNTLFERLGERLSQLTGYPAVQGYELYQSNGDSLDWIYSVTRTKAFTVELSDPYRPAEDELQGILDNNIKQPLYLTGIAGNLEFGSQIRISSQQLENQTDIGPYSITATIRGLPEIHNAEINLHYRLNSEEYQIIPMERSVEQPNLFSVDIPTQGPYNTVYYYIQVSNEDLIVTSPPMPYEYSFGIDASEESITTNSEIVAMIIMMVIIMGFFWGGFGYASFIAMKAEQRKLHEYYYGE